MKRILNYLGIARRAGFLISGTDAVIASLEKKAKLVIVATDASDATKDKISRKCYFYKVSILQEFSTDELAVAVGQNNPKILAITDEGIANQIKKIIERGENIWE